MRYAAQRFRSTRSGWGAGALPAITGLLLVSPLVVLAAPVEARLVKIVARWLENRITRPALPSGAHVDGIIVLGGASSRVRAALALAERFQDAPIVLSGPGDGEIAVARDALGQSTRLRIDRRPTTTYENARFSKDLVAPRSDACWAVVTSALHMPRAIGAFQAVGFSVLPWPVHDTPLTAEVLSAKVWHEVLGLVGYRAFGRSSSVFPSSAQDCALQQKRRR